MSNLNPMNYNIPSNVVGFGIQTGLTNISNVKALMYVFAPQRFGMQARRPMQYSFNDQFINRIGELGSQYAATSGNLNVSQHIDKIMMTPHGYTATRPSLDANVVVNIDQLSDNNSGATFVLITEGEPVTSIIQKATMDFSTFSPGLLRNTRIIYTGYFLNEPFFSPDNIKITPNPHAQLIITHKVVMDKSDTVGSFGTTDRLIIGGDNYIIPNVLSLISNQPVRSLTPSALVSGSEPQPNGFMPLVGDYFALQPTSNPVPIDSSLMNPHNNISSLIKNIFTTQSDLMFEQHDTASNYQTRMSVLGNGYDAFATKFQTNVMPMDTTQEFGMSENSVITMQYLDQRFPGDTLQIKPMGFTTGGMFSVQDQLSPTDRNMLSDVIVNSGISIMGKLGISEIKFDFDSVICDTDGDGYSVWHFGMAWPVQDSSPIVASFKHIMRQRIFPIIKNMRGDFRVSVSLNTLTVCDVILNFYSDTASNRVVDAPYRVPTIAGGLVTNMFGNEQAFLNNLTNMNLLVQSATDSSFSGGSAYINPAITTNPFANTGHVQVPQQWQQPPVTMPQQQPMMSQQVQQPQQNTMPQKPGPSGSFV